MRRQAIPFKNLAAPLGMSGGGGSYADRVLAKYPGNLVWFHRASESVGPVAINDMASDSTGECLANGGFETLFSGATWAAWQNFASNGAIANETISVRTGANAARLTAGASLSTRIYQDFIVTPGENYTLAFYSRGDGLNDGRYRIDNQTTVQIIVDTTSTGITGTSYTLVTVNFTAPTTCSTVRVILWCPALGGGIAYYDDCSVTGPRTTNGALYGSLTYGVSGPAGVGPAIRYSGSSTAIFNGGPVWESRFNPDVGSAICWSRVDGAARWTDATSFRYGFHCKAASDANAYVVFGKNNVNHQLVWRRKAGVGLDANEQTYTFSPSGTLGWFCQGYTWDISSPRLRGYLYVPGELAFTQVFDIAGANMNSLASLSFDDINTVFWAGATGAQNWIGDGALTACWAGVALTSAEMQSVMVP